MPAKPPSGQEAGRVAVIGSACRLPGAADTTEYWQLLATGTSAIREIPADRWDVRRAAGTADFPIGRWGGLLDGIDRFDHGMFAVSAREARAMDPQQRLLLEETWHCLEDAGIDRAELRRCRTAVFASVMAIDYHQNLAQSGVEPDGYAGLGSYGGLLANRLSHHYGWTGESVTLDAACAGSLAALHQARRALAAGECDFAVVAAASLIINPWRYASFSRARMLSPRGRCATFDSAADGYVPGEGVVVLLLRRAEDAAAAGNRCQGVILGTAVGHVGGGGGAITAPSIAAERAVITAAAAAAGVTLDSIGYVEAHGTGTALGDPIEIEALAQAFASQGAASGSCLAGSVKTNIGHLEAAAGLAGLLKVLLMLQQRTMVPTLNLDEVNPLIDFVHSPFRPALTTEPWLGTPRRAGISAFGFGGALGHAVVEEAPARAAPGGTTLPSVPILLSAATETGLATLRQRWRAFAAEPGFDALRIEDIAATLMRRPALAVRIAFFATDTAELRAAFAGAATIGTGTAPRLVLAADTDPSAALLAAIGRIWRLPEGGDLETPAGRRAALEELLTSAGVPLADPRRPPDLADLVRRLVVEDPGAEEDLYRRARALAVDNFTFAGYLEAWQRVLGEAAPIAAWLAAPPAGGPDRRLLTLALVASLRRLQEKWGLPERHRALGAAWHEAAALLAADTLSPGEAAALVTEPGSSDRVARAVAARRAEAAGPVADLVIGGSEAESGERALRLDPDDPAGSWLSLLAALWSRGAEIDWRGLRLDYTPVALPLYPFEGGRHWIDLAEPSGLAPVPAVPTPLAEAHRIGGRALVPAASMLVRLGEAAAPGAARVRLRAVEFNRPIEAGDLARVEVAVQGDAALLQIDGTVAGRAVKAPEADAERRTPPAPAGEALDPAQFYTRMAALDHVYGPDLRVIDRAWAEPDRLVCRIVAQRDAESAEALLDGALQAGLMAADRWGCLDGAGPFYPATIARVTLGRAGGRESWLQVRRTDLVARAGGFEVDLSLVDADGTLRFEAAGCRFMRAALESPEVPLWRPVWRPSGSRAGPARNPLILGDGGFAAALERALPVRAGRIGGRPTDAAAALDFSADEIYLLWALEAAGGSSPAAAESFQTDVLLPALGLFRRLAEVGRTVRVKLVTRGRVAVDGSERVTAPLAAALVGLGKCIAREHPALEIVAIDLPEGPASEADMTALVAAPAGRPGDFAIRRGGLLAPSLEPLPPLPAWSAVGRGVYVIAGGAGGLGRVLARDLAARFSARVALIGRRRPTDDAAGAIAALVADLRGSGGDGVYLSADIGDPGALEAALDDVRRRWGRIDGVINAAMVLSDLRLEAMDDDSFRRALRPKLSGTINLAAATRADRLSLFAVFSSALTLRGNPGQGNYVAGCAFQEAFCQDLRADGVPAQAVSWGLWGETGRVAGRAQATRIAQSTGLLPIGSAAGIRALYAAMAAPEARIVAARFDAGWDDMIAAAATEAAPERASESTPGNDLIEMIRAAVAEAIDADPAWIGEDDRFIELGVDSIVGAEVVQRLSREVGRRLSLHLFSDYPTPGELARHLAATLPSPASVPASAAAPIAPAAPVPPAVAARTLPAAAPPTPAPWRPREPSPTGDVAIIGMAGRFPGADDVASLWDLLCRGSDAVGTVPEHRWSAAELAAFGVAEDAGRLGRGGFIAAAESFDARFFGISPREALLMDPQQRVLLEETWNALADAGLGRGLSEARVGVFVGASGGEYGQKWPLLGLPPDRARLVAQLPSTLAARIAHVFDFRGPAVTVDAACASAVAALQQACDALEKGEVEIAVAGSVAVISTPQMPVLADAAELLSPLGRCRAFTAGADGMVLSEAVGVVVLKRLGDALAAEDTIHAVLRAAVTSHDGATIGLSAPSAAGQARLQQQGLAAAGLTAAEIDYVEAHGVGTPGGDAAELAALAQTFAGRSGTVALGSIKNNLGHTLAAAGMTSLFKVVLQLRHGLVAPTPGVAGLPPAAELEGGPFVPATSLGPWQAPPGRPRRAAINAFALNGANGFIVVEEAPGEALRVGRDTDGGHLVLVTAKTEAALRRRLGDLARWLAHDPVDLADLAFTLARGPLGWPWRAALVAADAASLVTQLDAAARGESRVGGMRFAERQHREPEADAIMADLAARLLDEAETARDPGRARARLLAAAELFVSGVTLEPPGRPGARRLTGLPGYPFERQRYWPGAAADAQFAIAAPAPRPELPAPADSARERLRAAVARVIRETPAAVPDDMPLIALGFDSLLAVELSQILAREWAMVLPVAALLAADGIASLAARVETAGPAPALQTDPAGRFEPFPLTDIQAAYWVGRSAGLALAGPCQVYWEFESEAGWAVDRLEAALDRVVACHDMLRAVVGPEGEQRVLPQVPPCRIEFHDWRRNADPAAALAQLREAVSARRFDPAVWPLFQVAASHDGTVMRLHLAIDLLIIDVPSLFRLLAQWEQQYRTPTAPLRPPGISFRDYVKNRQSREGDAEWRRAEAYWAEHARELPDAPVLRGQKALDRSASLPFRRHGARLSPADWTALRTRARSVGVTPVNLLVAAFAETLGHWAVEPRFTLNLTVVERDAVHPDVQAVIGDFTSTMLVGVDLAGVAPFAGRARALRDLVGAHLAHARYGGVRVLRRLAAETGRRSMMPVVFTSMLGYEALLGAEAAAAVGRFGRLGYGVTQTPQVWLDAQAREEQGALVVTWDAVDGLFPDGLFDGMIEAYAAVLRRLAASEAAWNEPLGSWLAAGSRDSRARRNATSAPLPDGLIHEPFLAAAIARPERPAVIAPDRTLSYGELAGWAEAVAAQLGERATGRLTAIAMDKGWAQIAAVMGVSMAGGAYLPVDPDLPAERLQQILAQAETDTILTSSAPRGVRPTGFRVIEIDRLTPLPPPTRLPPRRAAPGDLAYVIFTSGSTGAPKGVMIEHRAALNTVLDINERFAVGAADRVLGLSALGFDLSVYDIFGLLAAGGAVVLPAPRSVADPAHLAGLVARHGVTIWNSVPMFAHLLLEGEPTPSSLATLRLALLSGDWIPLGLPPRLEAARPGLDVISLGGATEASIWSIFHPIGAPEPGWPSVPYGTPLRNQSFQILDEEHRDCPDWVPGELHIGGAGLARGYWRDPVQTAARFVHHRRTGERLYRTGDIGRYRPDGLIEFLGRNDGQVKIGGHRVELGEIEAVASHHPVIGQAVAVAQGDPGRLRLVLVCVPVPGAGGSVESIRAFLKARLPGYMVPAEIALVQALPLTGNGKVDRRALAKGVPAAAPEPPVPVVPVETGGLERRLLEIWRSILADPALPADGNLFEIGADSLTAVKANAWIQREIGPCSVTDIFEFPTVRSLARHLAGAAEGRPAPLPPAPEIPRASRRRAFRAGPVRHNGLDRGASDGR